MLTSEDPCAAPTGPSQKCLRIAMLCLHTSPLRQPGQGDAGGMNVYVRHLASELACQGYAVDLITLWRDSEHPGQRRPAQTVTAQPVGELPGLRLVSVTLPETASTAKDELPRHLPAVAAALRAAAAQLLPRPDVLHGHYWLSGEVGRDLAQDWDIPLALTLHTSARGKNAQAAAGEALEPEVRECAEQRLIRETSVLVVNTAAEAEQMRELYDADPARTHVIAPGVDLEVFRPDGPQPPDAPSSEPQSAARQDHEPVIGFAGRLQPLKGPQILLEAMGLLAADPKAPVPRLLLAGVGDDAFTDSLHQQARTLGIEDRIEWLGSLPVTELAAAMRRADLWAVPSSSETFGLVALEAQACGTPVLASDAGGLRSALDDGRTGWLVGQRTPQAWAEALRSTLRDPVELARRGRAAAERARGFSWAAAARAHVEQVYAPSQRGITPGPTVAAMTTSALSPQDLADHLDRFHATGPVATPRQANLANIQGFLDSSEHQYMGVTPTPGTTYDGVFRLMVERVGISADPSFTEGVDTISAQLCVAALERYAAVLADAVRPGATIFFATAHPAALPPIYSRLAAAARAAGAEVLHMHGGIAWDDGQVRQVSDVMMVEQYGGLRHTHRPEPMELALDRLAEQAGDPSFLPDLVVSDHGMAGAAGSRGARVIAIADCNDPAPFVGEQQGLIEVVVPMDDNIPPEAYAPLTDFVLERAGLPIC
ncbi:hypothetical protein GCM10009594_03490 [Kocuria palustris]|uniref:phosphatase n=1 Tax=Kocuria palustris TaxID=71999 RepID=UPI00195C5BAF|nr:glycosyltransferase involved in cell wall biosynthesis [Kocuria palustris]